MENRNEYIHKLDGGGKGGGGVRTAEMYTPTHRTSGRPQHFDRKEVSHEMY